MISVVIIVALVLWLSYERGRRAQAEGYIRELDDEIHDLRSKPENREATPAEKMTAIEFLEAAHAEAQCYPAEGERYKRFLLKVQDDLGIIHPPK